MLKRFLNTRIDLVRLNDNQQFFGWVDQIRGGDLWIQGIDTADFGKGDVIMASLCAESGSAHIRCEVDRMVNDQIVLGLPSLVPITKGSPKARVRFENVLGEIDLEGLAYACELCDLSLAGMGIISPMAAEPGLVTNIRITTRVGVAETVSSVVYCTPVDQEASRWRIGARFEDVDRLSYARFRTMMQEASLAA